MTTYGSVCSGIEAASVAWGPLGWKAAWLAEIEPFPCGALAHHYQSVPNLGDFTRIRSAIADGSVEAPDILVGGTPCQAFSVAGLRQSMDDARGQLTLEFVRLADAIDSARIIRGLAPAVVVWENVPGVLNTPDNAFGCFLGALAGEDVALVPPGGKWTNSGEVLGPQRTIAWRILDAQYFGVAQRRRRVFVVASAGTIDPSAVLFEREGVRRDSPPSREAGQSTAGTLASRASGGSHWDGGPHPSLNQSHNIGGIGMSNQEIFSQRGAGLVAPCLTASRLQRVGESSGQDPVVACFGGNNTAGPIDVSTALNACASASGCMDFESETFVAFDTTQISSKTNRSNPQPGDPCRQRVAGAHPPAICATGDVFHTLRAEGFDASASGRLDFESEAFVAFDSRQDTISSTKVFGALGCGHPQAQAVAVREISQTITGNYGKQVDSSDTGLGTNVVFPTAQVRRLTPTECERLQGFPDGYTAIPWRGKSAELCPDGPRYKALGNSMAVPVMRWIGRRVDSQLRKAKP